MNPSNGGIKPVPITQEQMDAEMQAMLQTGAQANPKLANVPEKYRRFFQPFAAKPGGSGTIDLSKHVRPEERKALVPAGWDGKSPLPANISELLATQNQTEEQWKEQGIQELSQKKSLSAADLNVTPFEQASPEQQQQFIDMLQQAQMQSVPVPKVVDSRKPVAPKVAVASQPPVRSQAISPVSVAELLGETKPAAASTTAAVAALVTPEPMKEEPKPVAEERVCPRCSYDLKVPYTSKPTEEDIRVRILSILSVVQNGDGRFRKSYSLFGDKITINLRELIDEGALIYNEESRIVLSDNQEKATMQRMFSMDRINFRRHCCGLERLNLPGKTVEIPPLANWIAWAEGDVGKALSVLETFVRKCYPSESVFMAAGRAWMEFEGVVNALWLDQSFYKGTL